jgi:hypothetical protein
MNRNAKPDRVVSALAVIAVALAAIAATAGTFLARTELAPGAQARPAADARVDVVRAPAKVQS